MARTADHGERRRQVAEALLRTVAARGLARTTLVDVAEEAGVSVGLVQRYFRTKSDLLRFGVEYLYERGEERLRGVELVGPIRTLLFRLLETLLPLDAERRTELAVWLEFVPATLTDPEMSRIHNDTTRSLVEGVAEAVEAAQQRGELPGHLDATAEAASLVAFVDGLTLHHLATAPIFDAESIRRALADHIERLFTAHGTTK
ncbi:TetR family transcriptional regulator [Saccharomonospora sp. CUA-673]|uniref:TetR/AcrR family transcriptional regulator n=1 Tax=Saccharomonospora sp. CUA-673 TaxID=1904969 RepID=UPI0009632486|nr:TetR family transcriptional regulator C-terminal domain-containing protein [Saccharomonospora sp. CUA-673]OLT48396.1 TetR family transcriptional regulator [Saccharomonospora sp. CUA-673]